MKLFRRTPPIDPVVAAQARAVEQAAQIEHARQVDALQREQEAATREVDRQAKAAAEANRARLRRLAALRRRARLAWVATILATARTVAPLLVVNTATIGAQFVYALDKVPAWPEPTRVASAIVWALAAETIALYVGWHAHDALLAKAYSTAARLRRTSYLIAAVFGALNYSHFAGPALSPTPFAVGLGTLSLLSPWLWGLHTRRMQHVQLVREDLVDDGGAEFSAERRRAFPYRTWAARRWSIDHGVRDPRKAWEGYNAERRRRRAAVPSGRLRSALAVACGRARVVPIARAADAMTDQEREVVDKAKSSIANARTRISAGLARRWHLGILDKQMATTAAIEPDSQVTTAPTTTSAITSEPRTGHDSADLMAMAVAIRPAAPVAIDARPAVANPVPKTVASAKARRVVTSSATADHDKIRKLAKRKPSATDKELADAVGVSVSTVRRALGKKS